MRRLRLLGPACVESIPRTQANPAECAEYERSTGAVPRFRSRRTVAMLGYLVAERRSVARDFLAALFWPDEATSKGRGNLRRELHNLAQILPGCWDLDRQAVAFVPSDGVVIDLDTLQQLEGEKRWLEAAELLGGEFLEGVYLDGNLEFESWLLGERERWRGRAESILARVIEGHTRRGHYADALGQTQRLLQIAPWNESAHRQAMRLLAWIGQRGAALRQFETCKRALWRELGVEPAGETNALCQQIQAGTLGLPPQLPTFLTEEGARHEVDRSLFVARERQLAQLNAFLNGALAGQGQVVFVTGGPGSGKTALMDAFTRRAMEAHPDLLVTSGNCNAYSDVGDPYLPFRDVMAMLSGDVEAKWDAGAITRDHAQRLWAAFPLVVQALLDQGPHLLDVLVPGAALLSRALLAEQAGAPWLPQLREQVKGQGTPSNDVEQSYLFQQVTDVLRSVAQEQPLLLVLDDIQWADVASISLLFHLGRRLAGADSRVLIACAYRPEEVAVSRHSILRQAQDGAGSGQAQRHPLQKVLSELKRTFGDIWIDLSAVGESEARAFVDALVDSEPNRLAEGFRQALFRQTGGQPLFTIELLRGMQERGSLVRDADRRWIEGSTLDWKALPARVEGVIEERIGRLEPALHEILSVASVEGEHFTAEVVAQIRGLDQGQVLRDLAGLERRHRLVREREGARLDGQLLSRYQFSHILFQRYLYGNLSAAERRLLHAEIAEILEELYEGRTDEITVQLARHYAQANEQKKAVEYLLQAGDQARGLYAYQEAIDYYRRALAFLKEQSEHGRAARTLMRLGLTYHLALDFRRTRQVYEKGFALWQRAVEIQEGAPALPAPQALRAGLGHPTILDPTMTTDTYSIVVMDQLFSGLAERTSAMGVVPDVAQSWEVSEGGRKYVFRLREDVRWSDGSPVTAGDFAYAWKRVLDPATGSPVADQMDDIKGARAYRQGRTSDPDRVGVRALDDVTLEVELEGPTGYFPHLLTLCGSYPVPRHVVEAHGAAWTEVDNIVTNGPFRLAAWQRGRSAVLVRSPAYHGRFTGNVQRVEVSLVADLSERLALYEADGLDFFRLCDLPAVELDRARHRHAGEYVSLPRLSTEFVGFDASRPPFDDRRVRRAFVLATDRDTLVDGVLRGTAFPAPGGFVPPGMLGHSPGIALPYDPDGARQLLAEAGYPDGRGFPAVEFLTDHARRPTSKYLKAQWRENLGVEITQETMEWGVFFDTLDRKPPHMFCIADATDNPAADFLRDPYFPRLTRWQNGTYDRLVEEARRVTDQSRRVELYQEADRILVEEAAIMPFAYGRLHLLVKPWVRRWPTSTTKFWFWKDVIIDPH